MSNASDNIDAQRLSLGVLPPLHNLLGNLGVNL